MIARSTVRLECTGPHGVSVGSSFYHELVVRPGRNAPILITNRHVVEGYQQINLHLTASRDDNGRQTINPRNLHFPDLPSITYFHSNPAIDLAVILLGPILNLGVNDGSLINLSGVAEDVFVTPQLEEQLTFLENVIVVGFPQGLWDTQNNLPLFRRGITASPCMMDYEQEPNFLIDCAIYPGSSGSPVFLYNHPTYVANNQIQFGTQLAFLGVVARTIVFNAAGQPVEQAVPTAVDGAVVSRIPSSLGIVVKAREVRQLLAESRLHIERNFPY